MRGLAGELDVDVDGEGAVVVEGEWRGRNPSRGCGVDGRAVVSSCRHRG